MTTTLLTLQFRDHAGNNYVGYVSQDKASQSLNARLAMEYAGRNLLGSPFFDSWLPSSDAQALPKLARRLRAAAKRRGFVEVK